MDTEFDFAPLWRSGIGFDHLFKMLEQAGNVDPAENFHPMTSKISARMCIG